MDELQIECNAILDDNKALDEEKIELVEAKVGQYIGNGIINNSIDKERLVLDILWRHRDNKAAPVQSVGYKRVPAAVPSLKFILESPPPSDPTKLAKSFQKKPKKSAKKSYVDFDTVEDSWRDGTGYAQSDAMTPFDMLRNILGEENSDQDIEHALEKYGFDIQNILKLLMSEEKPQESPAPSDDDELQEEQRDSARVKEKIVCKYFIQWGECLRSDCMYSHDLTSTICRFWLKGHCLAGESCPFTHGIPEIPAAQEAHKQKIKPRPISLTADDFPTLGQARKKGSSPPPKPASPAKFEFRPSKTFSPSFLTPQDEFAPAIVSSPAKQQLTNRKIVAGDINKVDNKLTKLNLKPLNRNVVTVTPPQLVPWVQEDFGINNEYVSHRVSALRHADLRNKYLQLAAHSWHKNDGLSARVLSKKGQLHNDKMIEDYTIASDLLFEQRKQPHSEIYIDLHGMKLEESTEKLRSVLDQIEQEEKETPRPVYAICSSGHYFTRQKSSDDQLSKRVKDYLNGNGYEWKEFKTAETKFGKLIGIDPWSHI